MEENELVSKEQLFKILAKDFMLKAHIENYISNDLGEHFLLSATGLWSEVLYRYFLRSLEGPTDLMFMKIQNFYDELMSYRIEAIRDQIKEGDEKED